MNRLTIQTIKRKREIDKTKRHKLAWPISDSEQEM